MKQGLTAKLKFTTTPVEFARFASDPTGVSGCAEFCERLLVCTWQNEHQYPPPKGNVYQHPRSLRPACANGLQCPPSGLRHLHWVVDEVAKESGSARQRVHQKALQGPGQRATLRLSYP